MFSLILESRGPFKAVLFVNYCLSGIRHVIPGQNTLSNWAFDPYGELYSTLTQRNWNRISRRLSQGGLVHNKRRRRRNFDVLTIQYLE